MRLKYLAPSVLTFPPCLAHIPCQHRGVPQDRQAAYDSFQAAVEGSNDGYALYNLGYMHLKGWVVPRDPNQALQYFKRALERGVGPAANAIGVLATQGDGVGVDYRAAAGWFEKGANMSDPDSMYNLGTLYLHGEPGRREGGGGNRLWHYA